MQILCLLHCYGSQNRDLHQQCIAHDDEGTLPSAKPQADTLIRDFLQQYSSRQLVNGQFVHVPIIDGANTDEGTSFAPQGINNSEIFNDYIMSMSCLFPPSCSLLVSTHPAPFPSTSSSHTNPPFPNATLSNEPPSITSANPTTDSQNFGSSPQISIPAPLASAIEAAYPNSPCTDIPQAGPNDVNTTGEGDCSVPGPPYGAQYKRAASYAGDVVFIAERRRTCETWAVSLILLLSVCLRQVGCGGAGARLEEGKRNAGRATC